jgi:glyoxylase-like metal-dependent hydrolase (beta-lactamase superfamily II)
MGGFSMRRLDLGAVTAAAVVVTTLALAPAAAQDTKRAITQIAGDLYRFQNNFHFSVFLVTPDGVIATDPINAEAAAWLRDEIDRQFNQPIKYVIYSHDHPDHISGGEVFANAGATVVAHENAKAVIVGEQRPTAVPDITFSDQMTITLGGKTVELSFPGKSHSNNLIVMNFPAERAVFTVDFISVERLPYQTLGDGYMPDLIEAIETVEAMDFDIVVPGHGPMGTKADVTDHRRYVQELYDGVLAGLRAGQSVEEMQASLTLDAYEDWSQYEDWRPLNIEGMARIISMNRRGN